MSDMIQSEIIEFESLRVLPAFKQKCAWDLSELPSHLRGITSMPGLKEDSGEQPGT